MSAGNAVSKSHTQECVEIEVEMIPSFTQCRPIEKPTDIEECLVNPPEWVDRVVPLKKRSNFVIKNTLTDCHSTEQHFEIRPRLDSRTVAKTLVCHDYKGGYLSDSYIPFEGGEDKTLAKDGYPFYNWSQIDYFVYFSHYFITIPPLAWINAGHKNGVKVLGTIITEHTDGIKICDEEVFSTRERMYEFVHHLTDITSLFKFDGWLLNIENEVKNPLILKEFVEVLTRKTHEQNSENVVLWYDSVTKDGKLLWQDQLNEKNKCFFDSCDGIFLNYGWNEEKLLNTLEFAGPRHFDVFVGVDIFGRNMFGGGQFNTFKAAELISRNNLSMAIFAPGWTLETMEKIPLSSYFSRFLNRDDAFWASLKPYLYTHPISDYFDTDFHLGLDSKYYNLFIQSQQLTLILQPENAKAIPNHSTVTTLFGSCECLKRAYFEDKPVAMITKQSLRRSSANYVHSLFACDIKLSGRVAVYFLTKRIDGAALSVVLFTSMDSRSVRKIKLLDEQKNDLLDTTTVLEVNPLGSFEDNHPLNIISKKNLKYLESTNVALHIFVFSTLPCTLMEVGATISKGNSIQLLKFGIMPLR